MPAMQIIFATKAELEGAKQTEAQLQRQIGQAKVLGKDYKDLEGQLKNVQGVLANAKTPHGGMFAGVAERIREMVPGLESITGAAAKLASGPLGAIAFGLTALAGAADTAKEALNEYGQAEEKVAGLDAALAQTGQLTEEYREKLQELADQLQDTTGVADEQWFDVLKRLTQFGANSTNIEKYSDAVKDLAGLMEGDVQTAAALFAKAMQGHFEAFSRYGIVVEDGGTKTEKLNKLMEQLAARGGGQLEARSHTLNGQLQQLGNSVRNFLEAIGGVIARTGILQSVLSSITTAFQFWGRMIGSVIPKLEDLHNAAKKTTDRLEEGEKAAKEYALQLQGIEEEATKAAAALDKTITRIHALNRAQDEITDAKLALELAKIDQREERGQLTPVQAIGLREAAKTSSQAAKNLRGEQALRDEAALLEGTVERNKSEMMKLEERAQTAERNRADSEEFEKKRANLNKILTGQVDYAKARFNEYEASPQSFEDRRLGIRQGPRTFLDDDRIQARLQKEIRLAEEKRKNDLEAFDKLTKAELDSQTATAKARRDEATKGQDLMAQQNAKLLEQLELISLELAHLKEKRDINEKTARVSGTTALEKQRAEDAKKKQEQQEKDDAIVDHYSKQVTEALSKGGEAPPMPSDVRAIMNGRAKAMAAAGPIGPNRAMSDAWATRREGEVLDKGKEVVDLLNQVAKGTVTNFAGMAESLVRFNKALADLNQRLQSMESRERFNPKR
jgi:hypothetical protein